MAVIKEFRCPDGHGDFESAWPICPKCKKLSKRVFLTPPRIGSVKEQNINRILDDVLPAQNLSNYSNATGYPKPTFKGVYQSESGLVAGFGIENLSKLLPGVPGGAPLTRMDINTGLREEVNLETFAAGLPKAVSVDAEARIGKAHLIPTEIVRGGAESQGQ